MKPLPTLIAAAALLASPLSHAYFVRPFVQLGAVQKDGLVSDGVTARQVDIGPDAIASVDLAAGQTHNYLQVGTGGFGQSAGVMGDRLTFTGAGGTTLNFHFDFDGSVLTDAAAVPGQTLQIGVIANLRVFDASAGATVFNFATKAGALASDTRTLNFNNPTEALDAFVSESLLGSIDVTSQTPLTVDVFASLSIFAAVNANPVTVTMDFLNTGTFGIAAAPQVVFTSQSGVFPGSVPAVPEPGTWALMTMGVAALGLRRRFSPAR